jgi:hypothetical protein
MKAKKDEFDRDFEELTGELINAAGEGFCDIVQNLIILLISELNGKDLDNKLYVVNAYFSFLILSPNPLPKTVSTMYLK